MARRSHRHLCCWWGTPWAACLPKLRRTTQAHLQVRPRGCSSAHIIALTRYTGAVGAVVALAAPLVTSPWLAQVRLSKCGIARRVAERAAATQLSLLGFYADVRSAQRNDLDAVPLVSVSGGIRCASYHTRCQLRRVPNIARPQ